MRGARVNFLVGGGFGSMMSGRCRVYVGGIGLLAHCRREVVEEVDTVTSGFSEEVRVLFGRQRVCRGGGDLEW